MATIHTFTDLHACYSEGLSRKDCVILTGRARIPDAVHLAPHCSCRSLQMSQAGSSQSLRPLRTSSDRNQRCSPARQVRIGSLHRSPCARVHSQLQEHPNLVLPRAVLRRARELDRCVREHVRNALAHTQELGRHCTPGAHSCGPACHRTLCMQVNTLTTRAMVSCLWLSSWCVRT